MLEIMLIKCRLRLKVQLHVKLDEDDTQSSDSELYETLQIAKSLENSYSIFEFLLE